MPDLREQFQQLLQGRACLMGVGNVDYGDDGFGVRLAEELKSEGRSPKAERNPKSEGRSKELSSSCSDFGVRPSFGLGSSEFGLRRRIIVAGTTPERFIGRVADEGFDHLIFLDAVEFGGAAGSVVLINSDEIAARFPQVSTHKLSLGLLAKQAEANGRTKAWLLGVQPESLKPGQELTPTIQATLELLVELVSDISTEVTA
jgi:hydrogenase 3 maturation protease